MTWTIDSWKNYPILQQPGYNKEDLSSVISKLKQSDTIVSKSSVDNLLQELAEVHQGNKIILQIGDCAETFKDFSENNTNDYVRMFQKSGTEIEVLTNKKAIIVGRIAGQFAKPRSDDTETVNGVTLPSYRGDIANSVEFDEKSRVCDANRILQAYKQSKQTAQIIANKVFVSHECLVVDYDASMVRQFGDKFYCLSAQMLWIGYRTAQADHAHVEFLSGIENPIGLKVGSGANAEYLKEIISKLNPSNKLGKIILIARFGVDKIELGLSHLIKSIKDFGLNVIWINDPMHGNGYKAKNGFKTRSVANICGEIEHFTRIAKHENIHIGGLHLEASPNNITECVYVSEEEHEEGLKKNYQTTCDPRLNEGQVDKVIEVFCGNL